MLLAGRLHFDKLWFVWKCYLSPSHLFSSERSSGFRDGPETQKETKHKLAGRTTDTEERVTQREQVMWRLKRLLGDACNEGSMAGGSQPPSDSICTEDFVRRFGDEMIELTSPSSNVQQLDQEESTGRTVRSDWGNCQSEQREPSALKVRSLSSEDTETDHYRQRKELEKRLDDSDGVNTSWRENSGAGERSNSPQRRGDDGSSEYSLHKLYFSGPGGYI